MLESLLCRLVKGTQITHYIFRRGFVALPGAQSVGVSTRCGGGRRIDLLFTCNITGAVSDSISVRFPDGHEIHLYSFNTTVGDLPYGVNVHNQSVHANANGSYNYSLTLSFERYTTLNDSLICGDGITDAAESADGIPLDGCLVDGKFEKCCHLY